MITVKELALGFENSICLCECYMITVKELGQNFLRRNSAWRQNSWHEVTPLDAVFHGEMVWYIKKQRSTGAPIG
jgi:hypothetical protein